jgi:hypothetical protein
MFRTAARRRVGRVRPKTPMYSKQTFGWALAMALGLGISWHADAAVSLSGTRVILGEKEREASIPVKQHRRLALCHPGLGRCRARA